MNVCVIGGGIVGLSCAHYLAKAGASVTLVDTSSEHKQKCSWGNAGLLVPSHIFPLASPGIVALGARLSLSPGGPLGFRPNVLSWGLRFAKNCTSWHVDRHLPVMRDLGIAGIQEHRTLATDLGTQIHESGSLMVCESATTLGHESHLADIATKLGLPCQVLGPQELSAVQNGMEIHAAGAVHYHCDAYLNPGELLDSLQAAVSNQKVTIVQDTVTGFELATGRIVAANGQQRHKADAFVVANGVFAARLAPMLRLRLPLAPGRGQSFHVQTHAPPVPMVLMDARVAVTPMGGSVRFAGTMELGNWSFKPNMAKARGMAKALARTLPTYQKAAQQATSSPDGVWVGHRPCSPDGLPYIGPTSQWKNLHIATGHAMLGLSLGPVTGRLVAQTVLGDRPIVPLSAFSPDRYN